jgi:hypothetical protein
MAQDNFKCKLTTILIPDVTGCSRIVGETKSTATKIFTTEKKFMVDAKVIIFRSVFALLFLSFISCASQGEVKVVQSSDPDLIKSQKQSVFLFRLSAEIDGKPIDIWKEFNENRMHISIANIDKEGSVDRLASVYIPSAEMGEKGWFYLLLEPSAYYMKITSFWQPKFDPVLFYIPAASRLVYGGSFSFSCSGGLAISFQCSNIQVTNETAIAEVIADRFLKEYLPISPFIAEIITDSIPESVRKELIPLAVLTSINPGFELPSWRKSIWSRTTGVGDWATGSGEVPTVLKPYFLLGDISYGLAGVITAYIFYLPLALPLAAVTGEASQYWWKSCMQRHMDDLTVDDLQKEVVSTIQKEFDITEMENQNRENMDAKIFEKVKSFLEINILYIGLKECKPRGKFSPELSFRVKLWSVASKKVVYNKIFIFTNYSHSADFVKPYYYFLAPSPICREMNSYCDDRTRTIFRTEISNSIKAVGQVLRKDIGSPVN